MTLAFDESKRVEAEAFAILRPYLSERADGRLVVTSKGTLSRWLQESVGDVLVNIGDDEKLFAIELKAERRHTGNLFLETWSNKNLNTRNSHAERGGNPGWMWKIRADILLYYFLDTDLLYSIDVLHLKRWAFGYMREGERVDGRLYDFEEKLVRCDQLNDTWGRCVPISVLLSEMRAGSVKQTNVRQRGLLDDAA